MMRSMIEEIRERIEGLKEMYDTPVLDEVMGIIDEVEEDFAWNAQEDY